MGVKEWKFWVLPFPTTNGRDLLKALSRVGSGTGRPQTGSILPTSVICLTAFARKEVLGGQGTWASCSWQMGSEVPVCTRWTIRIASEKRSRKPCFQQWVLTAFDCSFLIPQVELERESLFCMSCFESWSPGGGNAELPLLLAFAVGSRKGSSWRWAI